MGEFGSRRDGQTDERMNDSINSSTSSIRPDAVCASNRTFVSHERGLLFPFPLGTLRTSEVAECARGYGANFSALTHLIVWSSPSLARTQPALPSVSRFSRFPHNFFPRLLTPPDRTVGCSQGWTIKIASRGIGGFGLEILLLSERL